jgi:lysozyme family protein
MSAIPNPYPAGAAFSHAFNDAIAFVLPHEEEFARGHWGDENYVVAENVSGDAGGWTKYGIDATSHPGLDVRNLTRARAIALYWHEWQAHRLDLLPAPLAVALFDVWVNGGHPIEWLQAALNHVENVKPPLSIDGGLGPKTLAAVAACIDFSAVLDYFIEERDTRFRALAQNPARAKFLSGWLRRDIDLRAYLHAVEAA